MLCAPAPPVKYQGNHREGYRRAEAGQPNLAQLRQEVAFERNPDVVSAGEVDLGRQEGRGKRERCQGGEDARAAW
jgi:hypothetical protein